MSMAAQGMHLTQTGAQVLRHFRVRFFRPPHAGAEPAWTQWHLGALPAGRYEAMYDNLLKGGQKFECEMVKALTAKRRARQMERDGSEVES